MLVQDLACVARWKAMPQLGSGDMGQDSRLEKSPIMFMCEEWGKMICNPTNPNTFTTRPAVPGVQNKKIFSFTPAIFVIHAWIECPLVLARRIQSPRPYIQSSDLLSLF